MLRVCKLLASMVQKVEQSLLLLVTVQATDLSVEGIGQNKFTSVSNFTLQKPINHPPVRLDVIYDVTHYSTLALESCYPRVTVSIFS